MMRSLTFLAWILLVAANPLLASQTTAPAATPSADASEEASVVQQSRVAWRFENDGTGHRDSYLRVKVLSDAGVEAWGQLVFPYNADNEWMDIVYVRVIKADGTVVTAPDEAVQDRTSAVEREAPVYTDRREKHITVPGLRPGETLEVGFTIEVHAPLARGNFWVEYDALKDSLDDQLQIDVPGDRQITLKTRPGFDPAVSEHDGRRVYEWHVAHQPSDGDRPKGDEKKRRAQSPPEPSAVRLTTFGSWEELGRWYRDLERPQRQPTQEVRNKAVELTAGRTTDLEKLETLYEYVATNFRYVSLSFGTGRYQPHRAADVLHNQYGDCKDKHTLLASLAESIGLHASTVLINTAAALDPDFPSPLQFDHVITRVALGSGDVWLDTTPEVAPFRLLAPPLRNKQALVIDPAGPARLLETPPSAPMASVATADIDAALSESGRLSAHVHVAFTGDYELAFRTMFRRVPAAQWKKMIERLSASGPGGDIHDWKVANPGALREPFTLEYQVTKANFVTAASKQFDLEFPLSGLIASALGSDDDDEGSSIDLGPARQSVYRIKIELPPAYDAHVPIPVSVTRDYGEYRADYRLKGRTFTAERSLSVGVTELPAARRGDYTAFARVVSGDLRQSLALEHEAPATIDAPAAERKADDLYQSGSDAVESSHFAQAVPLLKRVVELEPAHRGAWTSLGRAYLGLGQTDAAIDAFQKQIELNAYDLSAYNNLGNAYRTQQKYGEAEAAFLRQLEIDPLNEYAHGSLGGLYVEQHKYDAAVTELDKAIALSPQNPFLRVRLGEALLNLNQHERALAAFTRAVELDPTPMTWNNIAYQLVLKRTDLELAQRYAESAVAAITAASRTVSVDHITPRDVSHARSLAAYWDTLGWVYFANGEMDRAEKFVRASWLLAQHAEVGDHLGQIYEKQGRRDEAIRGYAMAMNGERPDRKIRDRLAALVGGVDGADALARRYAGRLPEERTMPLDIKGHPGETADFFVLLDNSSGGIRVENVAFITGDKALGPFADTLRTLKFDAVFPDDAPAKILRRGILSCDPAGISSSCRFILTRPEDAEAAQQQ